MLSRVLRPWLPLLLLTAALAGQGVTPPRPGYVLVDDMWLPYEVIYGDGYFNATAWPGGNVPYVIQGSLPIDVRQRLSLAFDDLEAVCDVDFRPRNGESDYVYIQFNAAAGGAAWSDVGMVGGQQELTAGPNASKFTLIHELMHTLGFLHEQSRPDRDSFVTINWGNISQTQCNAGTSSCDNNFQIVSGGTQYGPYDFLSIMHYNQFAWSVCFDPPAQPPFNCSPAQTTIDCKPQYSQFQNLMGMGQNMSFGDANGLISRYGQSSVTPTVTGVSPGAVPQNNGATTITVYGTDFYGGSGDGNGVLGTQIKVNGAFVPANNVTFVSPTRIDVVIPPFYFISPGCLQITADNYYGGTSGPWSLGVTANIPSQDFWAGGAQSAFMGSAVCGLGDVNGDLYDDVVIGSPGMPLGGQQDAGQAVCVSGKDGAVLWSRMGTWWQQVGASVANAGDVDGDGIDDVLIGAPGSPGTANATWGFAYLHSGADGTQLLPYTRFVVGDALGTSVANAGDVNGDGIPDQIIGIPGADQAKIYNGATGASIRTLSGPSGSGFGTAVAGGFRIGTDGVPDQAVGAPKYLSNRGRVYYYSGNSGSNFHIKQGDASGDHFGASLAMMQSPDGRNGGAVVIGAPRSSSNRGYVRLFGPYQGPFTTGSNYPLIATLNGIGSNDYFGWSVGTAGDVNQDGRQDVLVGAPENGSSTGYVHVYDGRTMTLLESETGFYNADRFGWSAAAAGDTNVDGVPDIVVGARFGSFGCPTEGYARVVHRIVPPEQRKVMITEVYWGTRAAVEVTNFGTGSENLINYKVVWDDGTRHESSPAPSMLLGPGETALLIETGGFVACAGPCTASNYYGEAPASTQFAIVLPSISTGGQQFAVALVDDRDNVVDEVRIKGTGAASLIALPGAGGHFRGFAPRDASTVSVERIWGLDSNSGGDWTRETVRSLGLENRSSGLRGYDPVAVPHVIINEMDDSPDYVELKNVAGYTVDLRNWFLLASGGQNANHATLLPWPMTTQTLDDNAFIVLGDFSGTPAEKPAWVPYVNLNGVGGGNIPWTSEEYDCALYDAYGRLVDLVRTSGHDDLRVHNHPRAPAPPLAFAGAAYRDPAGDGSVGRTLVNNDSDDGSDWVPLYTRSMGTENPLSTYLGQPGLAGKLDVRLNGTVGGYGLTVVINAGPAHAGRPWSFLFSAGHQHGLGPFFGLGAEALNNWLLLGQDPFLSGTLDARGSARIDIPSGALAPPGGIASPTFSTDDIFIVPASGELLRTAVIEWDT